jgi:hypothetical protein
MVSPLDNQAADLKQPLLQSPLELMRSLGRGGLL